MRAYVTSIGEPTTELCIWSLDRLGFDVVPIQDMSSLAWKLKTIYKQADDDFLRVDADVICNRNVLELPITGPKRAWWLQPQVFDWYKQDLSYGGIQFIKKQALPALRESINNHLQAERPETEMFRLPAFFRPRRSVSVESFVCGLNGWGQDDLPRVKKTKARRNQYTNYDWPLVEKMMEL